ncbi:hypothetical protein G6F38_013698 [Rhizopus arrhizus]|nr:hypothetical protein G6F38_013698 [Rhizopus arrhizus]
MVNNPFVPRNANQALIEHEMEQNKRHQNNNHNLELYDAEQQPAIIPAYGLTTNQNQLTAMDATPRRAQYGSNTYSYNHNYSQQSNHLSQQQELVDLIQRTIRSELDNQRQQYNRNYGRNNRNNYSGQQNRSHKTYFFSAPFTTYYFY